MSSRARILRSTGSAAAALCALLSLAPELQAQDAFCDSALTQAAMNECSGRAARAADRMLDSLLAELKTELSPGDYDSLTAVHGSWIELRRSFCRWEYHAADGGSIAPLLMNGCLLNLTSDWIRNLRAHLCNRGLEHPCEAALKYEPQAMSSPPDTPQRVACTRERSGHLVIHGDVAAEIAIPIEQLKAMPRTTVQGALHDGQAATFEGVTLRELLTRAAIGTDLRSGDLDRYVVVHAADGYQALFALAELDPAFREHLPILADTQNGGPLLSEYGPLQVIVPGEIRHARWVRQVTCLRIGRAR